MKWLKMVMLVYCIAIFLVSFTGISSAKKIEEQNNTPGQKFLKEQIDLLNKDTDALV